MTSAAALQTFLKRSISAEVAWRVIRAAESKAVEMHVRCTICVVDESGIMKATSRMDGASVISIQAARDKALTAVGTGASTDHLYDRLKDQAALLAVSTAGIDRFLLIGGGVPIRIDGELVGAVGVSGGDATEDSAIARAAICEITSKDSEP